MRAPACERSARFDREPHRRRWPRRPCCGPSLAARRRRPLADSARLPARCRPAARWEPSQMHARPAKAARGLHMQFRRPRPRRSSPIRSAWRSRTAGSARVAAWVRRWASFPARGWARRPPSARAGVAPGSRSPRARPSPTPWPLRPAALRSEFPGAAFRLRPAWALRPRSVARVIASRDRRRRWATPARCESHPCRAASR